MPATRAVTFARTAVLGLLVLIPGVMAFASGPVESVIHKFTGSPDGTTPLGALVADAGGNLYGAAPEGGSCTVSTRGCGVVFKLSPPATQGGAWTETILYTFTGGSDGANPNGTLIFDKQGNLFGGRNGGIFELSPPATQGGAWTETNLPSPGSQQGSKLLFYGGNFYGVTQDGGSANLGTAFILKPPSIVGGTWKYRIIHNFGVVSGDGTHPVAGLVVRSGSFYGITNQGGAHGNGIGTVFQLTPKNGVWTETILYDFTSTGGEGGFPYGPLIFDPAGNIYGTTSQGGFGVPNPGVVYELSPPTSPGSPWQETTLYSFTAAKSGSNPMAGVIRDAANNLYGTTFDGGIGSGLGVVFKLKPPQTPGGAWTEVVLHSFGGIAHSDGANPSGELILLKGSFYGTTSAGGLALNPVPGGTVFSLVQ